MFENKVENNTEAALPPSNILYFRCTKMYVKDASNIDQLNNKLFHNLWTEKIPKIRVKMTSLPQRKARRLLLLSILEKISNRKLLRWDARDGIPLHGLFGNFQFS